MCVRFDCPADLNLHLLEGRAEAQLGLDVDQTEPPLRGFPCRTTSEAALMI